MMTKQGEEKERERTLDGRGRRMHKRGDDVI